MKKTILIITLLLIGLLPVCAETIRLSNGDNAVSVINSTPDETILQYSITNFDKDKVEINNESYYHIRLPKEGITEEKGNPELPVFNKSIVIDNQALMHMEVYDVHYVDYQIAVAPSKGRLSREVNPDLVPYTFGSRYQENRFYPRNIANLSEPFILRDYRGITIETTPVAYNAVTQTLRIYTSFKIRVYAGGSDTNNVIRIIRDNPTQDFVPIYEKRFVNWQSQRYTPVGDTFGKLLVICSDSYLTQIAPYVNWKKQKGIDTELIAMSTIGTTGSQLKTYIQNRYTSDTSIAYVQLVGDAAQIPTISFTSVSNGTGGSDPQYALVAGSDNYPDIFIGRFSAESTTDVTTQVNKVLNYEKDLTTSASWLNMAFGIGSSSGTGDDGEYDYQHINNIRTDLLNYGYTTVDQINYDTSTAAQVSTAVNAGRGFGNYCGHGADTYWVTTGFSVTNVNALTNGNMTPFIMDVACVNGNFTSQTCFAEAWLRKSGGGAVGIYASSINQSWNPPMIAQDEVTDLLVAESKTTLGGLYYNGSCKMLEESNDVEMFKTWHIFGDASLLVRTKTPIAMTVTHPASITSGTTSVSVSTGVANALVAITYNNTIYAHGFANSSGSVTLTLSGAPTGVLTYTITATAFNRVTYVGSISQTVASGPYVEVTASVYADTNNNVSEYNESGRFNVTFYNSGTSAASNLVATLTCPTTGITITDNTESIVSLAAGASTTINNAYTFNIANNIANGTSAAFTITMISGANTWTYNFNQVINAPSLTFGSITISDQSPGNNNGIIDPGETVTVTIPVNNAGAAASLSGSGTLTSSTSGITINTGTCSFTSISASGNTTLTFNLTASSSIAAGTSASLVFNATAGAYTATKTESVEIGAPTLITIGTGTSSQTYPIDRYYNYSSHEAIYLASEVGAAGTIKTLAFYKSSGSDTGTIDAVTIYMKNTTNATLATGTYSTTGYTQVYSGTFPNTATSGWMQVTLTNPFLYNGTSNLGILILKGYQSYIDTGYANWAYTTSSTYRARQAHSDSAQPSSLTYTTYLPNLKLGVLVTAAVLNPPQTLIATAGNASVALSWTAPASGTPSSYKIYKNNTLLTTVTTLTYTDTAVTNGTGYTYYLTAVYTTPSAGESVASNSVSVTPNIYPPQTLTATAGNASVVLNWLAPSSGTPTGYNIYRNSTLLTNVIGLTYTDTAVVNGSSYSCNITATYSNPTGESTASNTVSATPTEIVTPTYLINENIQNWTVHASYGTYTQSITAGTVNMTQCIVTPSGSSSGTGSTGFVQMQASSGILTLPTLATCGTAEFHLRAGSSGRTLKLQKYNGSTWDDLTTFTIGSTGTTFSYNVNSGSSTTLRLSSPSNAVYIHDIIITSYTAASPVFSINTSSISYGSVAVGAYSNQSFSITNTGTGTLTGQITTPSGYTIAIARSVDARNVISYSLTANQSQTYTLTFAPSAVQSYNADLTITSNDANHPTNTINLTGAGFVPPTVSLSTNTINESLYFGSITSRMFQISNTGSQPLDYSISMVENVRSAEYHEEHLRTVDWINLSSGSGTVSAGQNQEITLQIDSGDTTPGSHQITLNISTNDPSNPVKTVIMYVEVGLSTPTCKITIVAGGITLNWDSIPGANAYKIYKSISVDSEFELLDTISQTSYSDTTSSQAYYYVKAVYE